MWKSASDFSQLEKKNQDLLSWERSEHDHRFFWATLGTPHILEFVELVSWLSKLEVVSPRGPPYYSGRSCLLLCYSGPVRGSSLLAIFSREWALSRWSSGERQSVGEVELPPPLLWQIDSPNKGGRAMRSSFVPC